jgi:hypothetical protein
VAETPFDPTKLYQLSSSQPGQQEQVPNNTELMPWPMDVKKKGKQAQPLTKGALSVHKLRSLGDPVFAAAGSVVVSKPTAGKSSTSKHS